MGFHFARRGRRRSGRPGSRAIPRHSRPVGRPAPPHPIRLVVLANIPLAAPARIRWRRTYASRLSTPLTRCGRKKVQRRWLNGADRRTFDLLREILLGEISERDFSVRRGCNELASSDGGSASSPLARLALIASITRTPPANFNEIHGIHGDIYGALAGEKARPRVDTRAFSVLRRTIRLSFGHKAARG